MRKQFGEASRMPLQGLGPQSSEFAKPFEHNRLPRSPILEALDQLGKAFDMPSSNNISAFHQAGNSIHCSHSVPPSTHPTPESSHE